MNEKLVLLGFVLVLGVGKLVYANLSEPVNPIRLSTDTKEGYRTNKIDAKGENRHDIVGDIEANSIVVVSLSDVPVGNGLWFELKNVVTGKSCPWAGMWYEQSRATMFTTSDPVNKKYYIRVYHNNNEWEGEYTINVKVLRKAVFSSIRLDAKGIPSSGRTYCISNTPELLTQSKNEYRGQYGYYLQRSIIHGNANIYWEHSNTYPRDMKFGVLLWNTDNEPLEINLNKRSYISRLESETPMTDVWVDYMKNGMPETVGVIKPDDSKFKNTMTLPAYNPANPSKSAAWIHLTTVPHHTDMSWGLFNGILSITVTRVNHNNELYVDSENIKCDKLYCDMYIMDIPEEGKNYVEDTIKNVANAVRAIPDNPRSTLHGSGNGAMLSMEIKETISLANPFEVVLGGFDAPLMNENEKVAISDIVWSSGTHRPVDDKIRYYDDWQPNATLDEILLWNGRKSCWNYGVIYKFSCNLTTKSSKTHKIVGKLKYDPKVNTGHLADPDWVGLHVVAYREDWLKTEKPPVAKTILYAQERELVFDSDVPTDKQVNYYVVISGMSSMPLVVSFQCEEDK